MDKLQFRLRSATHRQAERVTFRLKDNPTKSQFVNTLSKRTGIPEEKMVLTNTTRQQKIVDGPLVDQVCTDDEVVYSSHAVAGAPGD